MFAPFLQKVWVTVRLLDNLIVQAWQSRSSLPRMKVRQLEENRTGVRRRIWPGPFGLAIEVNQHPRVRQANFVEQFDDWSPSTNMARAALALCAAAPVASSNAAASQPKGLRKFCENF
jgi:hypothetical protein